MRAMPDGQVDLVLTSPPYALHFKKEYGNADQKQYVAWFLPFASQIKRILTPHGSFVLNVGGSWTPGAPVRSLYHFRLLAGVMRRVGFRVVPRVFWYNPAKMPAPAEWVNVRRIRVKDSVEYIFWLSPSKYPQGGQLPCAPSLQQGHGAPHQARNQADEAAVGPQHHAEVLPRSWRIDPGQHNSVREQREQQRVHQALQEAGKKIHPARFPAELPRFFIEFLTEPGDVGLDPFAGSNTTGAVAEAT